jgi:alpha-mannosidase
MHQHHDITLGRIQQFADKHLAARIYPEREPVKLSVYAAPGRISYAGALQGAYRPAAVGEQFGPPWSTHWFKVEITIPRRWRDREVHLLWDSSTEACVWHEGEPQQGLSGAYGHTGTRFLRTEYRLTRAAAGGEQITLMVEVACNGLFGVRPGHFRDPSLIGFLRQAEIAIFDQEAWHLYWDFRVIADMAQHLTPQTPRGGQALYVANRMVNLIDLEDRATWPAARALAAEFLGARNGEGQHDVSAVGHGHLDTAWLWPIAETVRKCVRTFSTAIAYMDDDPEYKFACSQAQQYEWIKDRHPGLYARLKEKVAAGQFVPVGGTWVEPDCNLPSGESLVRQFLFGQRFFRQEFGITCRVFWQPDVFGYSAALPQIMHGAGIDYFFSQKLSWNQFNQPPHHTFLWEGLDGSRVLVHFPPTDTYSSMAGVADLVRTLRQFKDHERARESLLLFGYGDGGGGPTRGMLEQLRRVRDVDGLPRVEIRSPEEFFARCAADIQDPAVWVGELYFELHRATYTTQAQAKLYNRRCESLLHDVEFLAAVACARHGAIYPAEPLARLWKLLLTLQFHDILPGSSIAEVYREAMAEYGAILDQGRELRAEALGALVPPPQHRGGGTARRSTRRTAERRRAPTGHCQRAANGLFCPLRRPCPGSARHRRRTGGRDRPRERPRPRHALPRWQSRQSVRQARPEGVRDGRRWCQPLCDL